MPGCILRYCKNSSRTVNKLMGITFHRFIKRKNDNYKQWLKFIQRERSENMWLPSENSYICSAHFQEKDFITTKTGRRFLKKDAVPILESDNIYSYNGESPTNIRLKKALRKAKICNRLLIRKCVYVIRRNKELNFKLNKLTQVIKTIKNRFELDNKADIIILDKAEVGEILKNMYSVAKKANIRLI